MRALITAIAAAGATWLMMLLVLGSEGLGSSVTGDVSTVQVADAFVVAKLGAAAVAFAIVLWIGSQIGLSRTDIGPVLAGVLFLDIMLVGATIATSGQLGLGQAVPAFVVVSAGGLQFVAVALAAWLAARPGGVTVTG